MEKTSTSVFNVRHPSIRLFLLTTVLSGLLFLLVAFGMDSLFSPYSWFLELKARLGLFGIYLILMTPVVAWGIFTVSRWGWFLFLIFYVQLVTFVLTQLPLHSGRGAFWWLILLVVAAFFTIWALMSRTVREPFFSAEERGWRLAERVPMHLQTVLHSGKEGIKAISVDVSRTGALIELKTESSDLSTLPIDSVEFFFSASDVVRLGCTPVRTIEKDKKKLVAVYFHKDDQAALIQYRKNLESKYENRHLFRKPATMMWPDEKRSGRLFNISRGGCYLEADVEHMLQGDDIIVQIDFGQKARLERSGVVAWTNLQGAYGKRPGLGIKFTDSLLSHPIFALYYFFKIKGQPLAR